MTGAVLQRGDQGRDFLPERRAVGLVDIAQRLAGLRHNAAIGQVTLGQRMPHPLPLQPDRVGMGNAAHLVFAGVSLVSLGCLVAEAGNARHGVPRQFLDGFLKGQVLGLHQEVENIPPCPAAEALVGAAGVADMEAGCLVGVKGAAAHEAAGRRPQLRRPARSVPSAP